MKKYLLTLEIETETDPREWYFGDVLVIDEPYQVVKVSA